MIRATRRMWAALLIVLIAGAACGSSEPADEAAAPDEPTTSSAVAVVVLEPPSGPMSGRLRSSTPVETVTSFLAAWQSGDFLTVVQAFDEEASRVIALGVNNADIRSFSAPGWYLDTGQRPFEFDWSGTNILDAEILTALAAVDALPVDLSGPVLSVEESTDPATVEVRFADDRRVILQLTESSGAWRIRRVDEADAVSDGPVFGSSDPTAGTGWTWCGIDQPVVFAGVDCSRVLAGMDGLTDEEQASIDDLRAEAVEDPSRALELTQQMQSVLGSAPGQVCRLMQSGQLPVGEAEIRANELAESTCPFWEPLDLRTIDHSSWRYGELDLATPSAAVATLIDGWTRGDWFDVFLTLSLEGQASFAAAVNDFDTTALFAPGDAPPEVMVTEPNLFVAFYEAADPPITVGAIIDDPVVDGSMVRVETDAGSRTFAVQQSNGGRWRVRAIGEGDIVDPQGPLFQPGG